MLGGPESHFVVLMCLCSPDLHNNRLTGSLPDSIAKIEGAWDEASNICANSDPSDISSIGQRVGQGNSLAGPIPASLASLNVQNLYV